MFSQIHPKYYFDKEIFETEKNKIFQNNWIFFCFKSDVTSTNDFVFKYISGIPIVVQNFGGEIKAFMNVCTHRFSLIQTESKGNRSLFCPYHGWSFDKNGNLSGMPKRPLFKNFDSEEKCKLKLKEYNIGFCGELIFINLSENPIRLEDYLGKFFEIVESISSGSEKLIDVNEMLIKANWKIIVENTLESYHVNLVHSETFKKLGAKGLDFDFDLLHSSWNAELNLKEDDVKLQKIHKNFTDRKFKSDGYKHILIYPNLLISTTYGVSFNFSIIDPISPSESKFVSYVFTSNPSSNNPLIKGYDEYLKTFNRDVFEEDRLVCENVQIGVSHTESIGALSLEEKRVHHFQKTYLSQIHVTSED